MANNLKDHLKEVADAIRAKKSTSDLINPQDFATEIEGISGGGSGEGSIEYWSMPTNAELINEVALLFLLIKGKVDGNINIFSAWNLSTPNIVPTAFAIDREIEIVVEGAKMKVGAFIENMGLPDFSTFGWVQITKEQFYDLNA